MERILRTHIIGEPGGTHEGDFSTMVELIHAAKRAGCDAVKFQWLSSAARLVARRRAEGYGGAYQSLAFPFDWHTTLRSTAHAAGLSYYCSVYLPEDVYRLSAVVDGLKISSFEVQDETLVRLAAIAVGPKPLIVSTGMCDGPALGRLKRLLLESRRKSPTWVLHCTSAYPAPASSLHLRAIRQMPREETVEDHRIGYSDHSRDMRTGALAAAVGATVLEVHYRLYETKPSNPDYNTALSPAELKTYVTNVRWAEEVLGSWTKDVQPAEQTMTQYIAQGGE